MVCAAPGQDGFCSPGPVDAKSPKRECIGNLAPFNDASVRLKHLSRVVSAERDRDTNADIVRKPQTALLPRSLIGKRQSFPKPVSPLSLSAPHRPPPPHPSFAVASTLFQRDQCGLKTPWRRHAPGTVNADPNSVGSVFVTEDEVNIEKDIEMEDGEGEDEYEYEEVAWISNDDGTFADFGNSDFMPMARLQL